uniref:Uncharacterized protein n=1 Tax=Rhizobium meliloti TaxID=382 RepID=I2E2B1_RHIML|nr:short hypothetical protein [Sinorhizobium meliloti]
MSRTTNENKMAAQRSFYLQGGIGKSKQELVKASIEVGGQQSG